MSHGYNFIFLFCDSCLLAQGKYNTSNNTVNVRGKSVGSKGTTSCSSLFVSLLAPPWITQKPSVFLAVFCTSGAARKKPGQPTLTRLVLQRVASAAGISKPSLCHPTSYPRSRPHRCADSTSMATLKVTRLNQATRSQLQPDTSLYAVWSCSRGRPRPPHTHARTHTHFSLTLTLSHILKKNRKWGEFLVGFPTIWSELKIV